MSEMFATPDQAEELANTLYFTAGSGVIVNQSMTGDYFQRGIMVRSVPEDLGSYLPSYPAGTPATAIVRAPVDGHMPHSALRLSWEYDPVAEAVRAGDEDAQSRADQRGFLFTTWRAGISPRAIERVSGLYDQLPASAFPAAGASAAEMREKMSEAKDTLRLMAETTELEAWKHVELGLNDPRITFDEASALIGFAYILRSR